MARRPSWYRRTFRFPFSPRQLQVDVDDELLFHLEMRAARLIAEGLEPEAARAEAGRRFGDLTTIRRDCLEIDLRRNHIMRFKTWFDDLRLDITYALRSVAKNPTFTLAAVLTLGVGIGAVTTIFSLVDAVVLRPWPMPEADRVVFVAPTSAEGHEDSSPGLAMAWGENSRQLEYLAAFDQRTFNLTGEGKPKRITGRATSADYFRVLGVQPILGRGFSADDDKPGSQKVVVLAHRLWSRQFASDRQILGRSITLSQVPHTVVGVLPSSLDLDATSPELFVPLALAPSQRENFGGHYLTLLGRMAAAASRDDARHELAAMVKQWDIRDHRTGDLFGVDVVPMDDVLVGPYKTRLGVLFGAVVLVLLITCGNVASLLLARCASRTRELGIRASLGAGRARIAAQLLNESLVVAVAGGLTGLFLARGGIEALVRWTPADIPRLDQAALDGRVLAFALLVTLGSSLGAGLAPAWRSSRLDLQATLRGGATSSHGGRDRLRSLFVITQVALSMLLLTAAGLLIRSSVLLQRVDPGFATEGILTAEFALPESDYPDLPRALISYTEILSRVEAIPGVESAALASAVPLAGPTAGSDFALVGQPLAPGSQAQGRIHLSSPGYFAALDIPLIAGRDFSDHDRADTARSVIVNETLARRLIAGETESLVGRQIYTELYSFVDEAGQGYPWEVVGVVSDVRDQSLRTDTRPAVYLPLTQAPSAPWGWTGRGMLLVAKTGVEPEALVADLRTAVSAVVSGVPLYDIRTMGQRLAGSLAVERFNTRMLSGLGLIGLLLAAFGIYGLVAFFVGQRLPEMGVRVALGATAREIRRLVVTRGLAPVWVGVVLGLAGAASLTGVLESQLYGISATDPMTFAIMSCVLLTVAWLACYLPARQASQADPREILRE